MDPWGASLRPNVVRGIHVTFPESWHVSPSTRFAIFNASRLDKMAPISQTIVSGAFLQIEILYFE